MRDMNSMVCSVTKALGSVSHMWKAGNKVVFNPPWHPEGSYIERAATGEKLGKDLEAELREYGITYCREVKARERGAHAKTPVPTVELPNSDVLT